MATATTAARMTRRDDRGRVVAADGLPVVGLATVQEVAAVTGLSQSTLYAMMTAGEIESRRFGRARRIPWVAVREMIGADEPADADDARTDD